MTSENVTGKMSDDGCAGGGTFLSRLFSLIETFLPHHCTVSELISFTKEKERELLISLSQIFNLIRSSTKEQQQQLSSRNSVSQCGDDEFLTKIVATLASLVNAKSQFVRHMVGNIFLAISEFLLPYGGSWDRFIHLLCVCFEFAMCNILRHAPQSLVNEADDSKSTVSIMRFVLNNSNWKGIAEILRIFRAIIKHMKGTNYDDDELIEVLLNYLSACLTNVPWNLINGIHNDSSSEIDGSSGDAAAEIMFMGNLVQLLCSLVSLSGSADLTGSRHKSAILYETCDFVPRLLVWCQVEEWSHILPYFRHKILVLMLKLSFHMQLGCSILILLSNLLHEYYQDLLSSSISLLECGQNDTLEGSPFLLSLDDLEVCYLPSHHLQSKAVFLFLRCSLSLISLGEKADFKCTCTRPDVSSDSVLNTAIVCFAKKKGLLQFYEWLQGHVPSNLTSENEIKLDMCIKFAASFIRFYMQEDDMLFEVLLQMFSIPSWAERLFSQEGKACQATEEAVLFHVSNLFNPLLLFHVFLAELQYDHQLLLDYLISKDIGGKCAEYLLRCLRIVCDSWKLFVEYSVRERLGCQSFCQVGCKRKRGSHDDSSAEWMDTSLQSGLALSAEKNQVGSLQLEAAKGCLVSLKSALRKLHRKKLFPYNPEVLIRRLSRFEELCDQLD